MTIYSIYTPKHGHQIIATNSDAEITKYASENYNDTPVGAIEIYKLERVAVKIKACRTPGCNLPANETGYCCNVCAGL
jgi:hypothetical protein